MGAQPCSSKTGCGDILPGHHLSPEILPPGLPQGCAGNQVSRQGP